MGVCVGSLRWARARASEKCLGWTGMWDRDLRAERYVGGGRIWVNSAAEAPTAEQAAKLYKVVTFVSDMTWREAQEEDDEKKKRTNVTMDELLLWRMKEKRIFGEK